MLADYHIHTVLCGHALGRMEEYIESAIRAGIDEMGFSDHFPMEIFAQRDPSLTMTLSELDGYVRDVLRLKKRYEKETNVVLSTEADYVPGIESALKPLLEAHPFDYVIGSVHFIDGWGFDDERYMEEWERRDTREVWSKYFDLVMDSASTGLYDVIGHCDLVKKFGYYPAEAGKDWISGLYRRAARRFREAGVAVEINTSGLRKPVREIYPSPEYLRILNEEKVPLVIGSDSHGPSQVAEDFAQALKIAKEAGFRTLLRFDGRKRREVAID